MDMASTTERAVPTCWICGAPLRIGLTRNRKGKVALTLWCSSDGRHWRAFCNDRRTVEEVVARLEAQRQTGSNPAAAGLQNPEPASAATSGRTGGRRT
jgi:hypothetical protein